MYKQIRENKEQVVNSDKRSVEKEQEETTKKCKKADTKASKRKAV